MDGLRQYRLRNGLQVVIAVDRRMPLVAVRVRYGVGSVHDPPGLSGLAHLTEHLLYDGRRRSSDPPTTGVLYDVAASDANAETSVWHMDFHETVPSADLATALWLERQRMAARPAPLRSRLRDESHHAATEHYQRRAKALADRLERDPTGDLDAWAQALLAVRPEQVSLTAARVLGPDRFILSTGARPG